MSFHGIYIAARRLSIFVEAKLIALMEVALTLFLAVGLCPKFVNSATVTLKFVCFEF